MRRVRVIEDLFDDIELAKGHDEPVPTVETFTVAVDGFTVELDLGPRNADLFRREWMHHGHKPTVKPGPKPKARPQRQHRYAGKGSVVHIAADGRKSVALAPTLRESNMLGGLIRDWLDGQHKLGFFIELDYKTPAGGTYYGQDLRDAFYAEHPDLAAKYQFWGQPG